MKIYMKRSLFLLFFAFILVFSFQVYASHYSYTGTDYEVCRTKCVNDHPHLGDFASIIACDDICSNIVSNNQNIATPTVPKYTPPEKKHSEYPSATGQDSYTYMQICIEYNYAPTKHPDNVALNCIASYDGELAIYYQNTVLNCYPQCLNEGYDDCTDYCNSVNQKYNILSDKRYVNQAANDVRLILGDAIPVAPTCSDGIKNQGETLPDCGGPCAPCAMKAPTGPNCYDRIKNRDETGIDCGGVCKPCPTCDDEIKNQGEEVDCGGPCRSCSEPDTTCDDGIQNQGEEYVDCGGPCTFVCPTCDDGMQNQGEKTVDCGGPCTQCVMTFEDLPKEDQILVLRLWVKAIGCVSYYKDKDCAALAHATAQRIITEAAKEKGADPSKYDVFEKLKQLQEEQKSMSDEEKNKRIGAARVAYQDMTIDQYALETGHAGEEIKKVIENKKEELKAEFGRIVFFDQENTEANMALADLYFDEGNKVESVAFYYNGLKNANDATKAKIEKRLAEVYEEQAASQIGFSEVPRLSQSQVLSTIHNNIDDPSITEILLRDKLRWAKAMAKSVEISPNRGGLMKLARDTLFSINSDKIDYLGDPYAE